MTTPEPAAQRLAAPPPHTAWHVFLVFLRLGLTSFGGPVAHLAYFRREFVERRGWISDADYADLVALCQFLPGPASSQAGFALGLRQAGLAGGIAAFAGFTTPSALLMFAAAAGLIVMTGPVAEAVVHGLLLVAVSVVAQAVYGMARSLCRDAATIALAAASCMLLLVLPLPFLQPAVIAGAAGLGALLLQPAIPSRSPPAHAPPARGRALLPLLAFAILLVGLPTLAFATGWAPAIVADAFYRSGALVFGGGHVVLPLLEAETVGRGWLAEETFLAGYGAAQALPGPLFAFAAFLGAASGTGLPPLAGGLIALVCAFLPGFLLVAAVLPVWRSLVARPAAAGAVRAASAAVVGVLAAALWRPVITTSIAGPADIVIAAAGFLALQVLRWPSWAVVALVAAAGMASRLTG